MGRYALARWVPAVPEVVFGAWTDPVALVDWMDSDAVIDRSGPLDLAGSAFTLVIGGPWRFRMQVIRVERPGLHVMTGTAPFGATVRFDLRLAPRDGGTDLELMTAYALPFGAIGRWLDRRFVDRPPRAVANRELDRFVDIASGSPPVADRASRPAPAPR
jgi:hypothetical protein